MKALNINKNCYIYKFLSIFLTVSLISLGLIFKAWANNYDFKPDNIVCSGAGVICDGPGHNAGGSTSDQMKQILHSMIEDGTLKKKLHDYLDQVQFKKSDHENFGTKVSSVFFTSYPGKDILKNDIDKTNYIMKDSDQESCVVDSNKSDRAASAIFNLPGSSICFDMRVISTQIGNLPLDVAFKKLLALAIHEHAHHFQKPQNKIEIEKSELYASTVGSFVEYTLYVDENLGVLFNPMIDFQIGEINSIIENYNNVKLGALTPKELSELKVKILWALNAQKIALSNAQRTYDGKYIVLAEEYSGRGVVGSLSGIGIYMFSDALEGKPQFKNINIMRNGLAKTSLMGFILSLISWAGSHFVDSLIFESEEALNAEKVKLDKIEQIVDQVFQTVKIKETNK